MWKSWKTFKNLIFLISIIQPVEVIADSSFELTTSSFLMVFVLSSSSSIAQYVPMQLMRKSGLAISLTLSDVTWAWCPVNCVFLFMIVVSICLSWLAVELSRSTAWRLIYCLLLHLYIPPFISIDSMVVSSGWTVV